jgi:hypothetical protein
LARVGQQRRRRVLKQNTIYTIERGARHQANEVLQVSFSRRCERWGDGRRGGGQPGPCQR